nr:MAG TPA: hypothetical protein [Caudoviricetes sp.]
MTLLCHKLLIQECFKCIVNGVNFPHLLGSKRNGVR